METSANWVFAALNLRKTNVLAGHCARDLCPLRECSAMTTETVPAAYDAMYGIPVLHDDNAPTVDGEAKAR